MARRLNPRRVTLGGDEAVALTPKEYEQLVAARRQIGGQSARVRVLAQEVKRTEQLLQDLEALVEAPGGECPHQAGEQCPAAEFEGATVGFEGATVGFEGVAVGFEGATVERDADGGCLRCSIAALLRRHRGQAA
ncbi:hypothetical protein AB0D74_41325 [Streptomyces sp. NPDC048278]|uniref:hypothetical protein n=1 Tax=Streptomyces sp. NPDC048278 TaxID=3155809 RepID=UPI003432CFBC